MEQQQPAIKRTKKSETASSSGNSDGEIEPGIESSASQSIGWAKFIRSLFEMASNESNEKALGFSKDGLTLEIRDTTILSTEVLPKYFKHRNVSSVIRQLSNYGFKKTSTSSSNNVQCFMHENFRKDRMDLLGLITRRGSQTEKKESKHMKKQIDDLQRKDVEQKTLLKELQSQNQQLIEQNQLLLEENKRLNAGWAFIQETQACLGNNTSATSARGPPTSHHRLISGLYMDSPRSGYTSSLPSPQLTPSGAPVFIPFLGGPRPIQQTISVPQIQPIGGQYLESSNGSKLSDWQQQSYKNDLDATRINKPN